MTMMTLDLTDRYARVRVASSTGRASLSSFCGCGPLAGNAARGGDRRPQNDAPGQGSAQIAKRHDATIDGLVLGAGVGLESPAETRTVVRHFEVAIAVFGEST
jgi:hypothetical protein